MSAFGVAQPNAGKFLGHHFDQCSRRCRRPRFLPTLNPPGHRPIGTDGQPENAYPRLIGTAMLQEVCIRPSRRAVAVVAMIATVAWLLISFATGRPAGAAVPTPTHTVIVVMENHSFSETVGAPYISTLVKAGALMTDSHGVRHPSQPNYLALWSGSTQAITDDSCPHTFNTDSLGQQLQKAGKTAAIYSENLPAAGSTVCSASGGYARKHNPLVDFPATSGARGEQAVHRLAHELRSAADRLDGGTEPEQRHARRHDRPGRHLAEDPPGPVRAVGQDAQQPASC